LVRVKETAVPVTMISPLARFCWKKDDCSVVDAIVAVLRAMCGREGETAELEAI
jgi:hypothetical protein